MTSWDGKERRRENLDLSSIKTQLNDIQIAQGVMKTMLENYHTNNKQEHEGFMDLISKHNDTLYGNGHDGLTTKVKEVGDLKTELSNHSKADMKWFIFIAGLLVTILGWVVFGPAKTG